MSAIREMHVFGLVALGAGFLVASFSRRAPMRGWVGVALLLVASLAWAFIDSGEDPEISSLPMFLTFLFTSPISIVYSFRARRVAPDRLTALAAFAGSFVVSTFLLFMVAGILYLLTAL